QDERQASRRRETGGPDKVILADRGLGAPSLSSRADPAGRGHRPCGLAGPGARVVERDLKPCTRIGGRCCDEIVISVRSETGKTQPDESKHSPCILLNAETKIHQIHIQARSAV